MKCFISFSVIFLAIINCHGDNILVFWPVPTWSHYIQVAPLFHTLALRGHNVTEVSPYPPEEKMPNFRHIFMSVEQWIKKLRTGDIFERVLTEPHAIIGLLSPTYPLGDYILPEVLESSVFHDLIQGDNEFDLIISELFFLQEAFVALGHLLKAPIVALSSSGYSPQILRYSGAMNAIAYLPYKGLYSIGPMSLLQRLDNALTQVFSMIVNEYRYFPRYDAILAQYISKPLPAISELLRNVSLYLITANTAIDGAKLYPPNVIEISGMNLIKRPKPLDEDSAKIMETSKHGVIYMSFGSYLKMSNAGKGTIQKFLNVFEKLNETVIWSAGFNATEWDIPKNVHVKGWVDQNAILAHPKCILFITHGGASSITEAIYHAKPLIGTPFFHDQVSNTAAAQYFGYGLQVPLYDLTEETLLKAIKTVLADPRFKENISKGSTIFKDKPMSSLDTAIYWIEYVTRHKGAHHLKPLTVQMPWYQIFFLDVIAVYITATFGLFFLMFKLVVVVWRHFFPKLNLSKEKIN